MGMAASQGRLLALTRRKFDNEWQTIRLTNQKTSLQRDMQQISQNYRDALNSTVLKWSNNSGVSYVDLTYSNLMTPSEMNQYTPYMLTDSSGKIVIDNTYSKYAEMISLNGAAGGDYESVRTNILSSLTGLDADTINNSDIYSQNASEAASALAKLEASEPQPSDYYGVYKSTGAKTLLEKMGNNNGTGVSGLSFSTKYDNDWAGAYASGATISISSYSDFERVVSTLHETLRDYFPPDNQDDFDEAVETFLSANADYETRMNNKENLNGSSGGCITGKSGSYKIDVVTLVDELMGNYKGPTDTNSSTNATEYIWYDIDSSNYTKYVNDHAEWQEEYEEAQATYGTATDTSNSLLTADQERQIAFYDTIFSAIADNGWTYNNQISDTDYLNQMLQNNIYTITTNDASRSYDSTSGIYTWNNTYTSDIASNCYYVYSVTNADSETALADYEYQKSIVSAKEDRIDTRLDNLETELSAINQMIQGLETVRGDNIERTFGTFG